MKFSRFLAVLFLAILTISDVALAQKKRSSFAIQDSLRRQALQASAKEWFERNYLPYVSQVLNPIDSYGVSVTEPSQILPPDLGGPLNYIQIVVEGRINGWNYTRYHRHGRFSQFPPYGEAQCRLKQKLWAHVNSQGFPTKIMKGQAASSLVACASPGLLLPEYHGIERPRW